MYLRLTLFSLSQFSSIFRKELYILQFDYKKSLNLHLKNRGLTLWYIGLGLEKYLNYPIGLGFIL